MKLLNYIFEARLSARHKWTHFKVHKYELHRHIVWGKLSLIVGQPHLELVSICAVCQSPECHEVSAGDEGWTVCPDCGSIEQGYEYMTLEQAELKGLF